MWDRPNGIPPAAINSTKALRPSGPIPASSWNQSRAPNRPGTPVHKRRIGGHFGLDPRPRQTMKSPWEAEMAGTFRTGRRSRFPHLTLNSDGRSHPMLNAASVLILLLGLLSFALGLYIRSAATGHAMAVVTAATGLLALVGGLFTQMMSATREERVIIVTGMIAGFVGLALGLAHGGFSG